MSSSSAFITKRKECKDPLPNPYSQSRLSRCNPGKTAQREPHSNKSPTSIKASQPKSSRVEASSISPPTSQPPLPPLRNLRDPSYRPSHHQLTLLSYHSPIIRTSQTHEATTARKKPSCAARTASSPSSPRPHTTTTTHPTNIRPPCFPQQQLAFWQPRRLASLSPPPFLQQQQHHTVWWSRHDGATQHLWVRHPRDSGSHHLGSGMKTRRGREISWESTFC